MRCICGDAIFFPLLGVGTVQRLALRVLPGHTPGWAFAASRDHREINESSERRVLGLVQLGFLFGLI